MTKNNPNPEKKVREPFMPKYQRKPPAPRYSISHVTKVFKEVYDIDVVKLWRYKEKGNTHYNLYDNSGKCVCENVTLASLAEFLIKEGDY